MLPGVLCAFLLYNVSDIFRPFLGFRDLRIVSKEPKQVSSNFSVRLWLLYFNKVTQYALQPRKSPIVLCFVEFTSSQHASKAIEVLQGELDRSTHFHYVPNL